MQSAAYKSSVPPQNVVRISGFARWALLLLLFLTAAGLVLGSFVGLQAARDASMAVARVTGAGIVRDVRRELRRSRGEFQTALDEVFGDLKEDGLGYVAIVDDAHKVIASAGSGHQGFPEDVLRAGEKNRRRFVPPRIAVSALHQMHDDGHFHIVVPLRPGPPGQMGRMGHMRHMGSRLRGQRRAQMFGADRRGRDKRPRLFMAFEFEPVEARGMMRRAMLTFVISLVAALLLLGAGLAFWRMQGRSEQLRLQLAADGQLKALGQMSAVLGHELRNPLTALKGHAQLLLELLGDGQPGHSSASQVVREAQRLEQLTTEVLDFARSGQLQIEAVVLADFVRGCVDRAQAGDVIVQLADGLTQWPLDPARIERVLANLLRNARQSSGEQGRVQILLRQQNSDLYIEVEDNGPGLPPGEDAQNSLNLL